MRTPLVFSLFAALGCSSAPLAPAPAMDSSVPETAVLDAPSAEPLSGDAAPPPADAPRPSDASTTPLRVLFIGNSYTYVNDLPALVVRIAAEGARAGTGPTIEVDSVTVGGATLADHWNTMTAPMRVNAGGWSAVVLQGQSLEPALGSANFRTYAVRFGMLVNDARARPVFYATWPRRAGDEVYSQAFSGGNQGALNMRLDAAYTAAAAEVQGTVAHVGNAWVTALRTNPAINLYADDGSHPSPAGTWLAGCVMYRALTGVNAPPQADAIAPGVSAADARALREVARDTP